ncbi:odorant receptor 30a-like [Polistes fuscatus]|uniref:odorant receptor 30a-like n=1 Tax=Polistes fuscatus TaxID=30207 RepID=UPI001CA99F4B|nr:odorant receptor 30a-like [Polistes fuscatus]
MIQTVCMIIATVQMSIKMLACRVQRSSFQSIVVEMENVFKLAKPYEKMILTKYVDRCSILHISLTFGFYLAATNIVLGPIFLPQPLPTFAVYPFNVSTHPIYEIVYFIQAISAIQAVSGATIDCQAAVLLWFAGARFEMLHIDIANTVDEGDLKWCIFKHRKILCYAENVVKTVRFVILATVGITTVLIVFSGILLLFSSAIGSAAYNLNWVEKSQKMSKNILFLILRSQKPVIIKISGFLPSLSLSYYMSFLSSSFSYFTTMRALIN